ncbi:HlyD family efflux transporter periplasmic adaptor subunit [Stappia sp. BW2]|jgi:multidrug resistance efflux pump|uniref:HlyD family secretion protein n=1 Tax=Stappia sp. BW2 TaxID=2592622 RepID=UPI0011DEE50F|nr:HlyD family efflux transporter periplasmic adaptor subunit [Stappia sp. BW2]TYC80087.1 HlyD family efflux transporter periplasmic adaptor subunit [Stappia sp. BW2]
MRILRLLLAGLVIVTAGFVIAGEHLSGTSADAVINARLTTVRAPTAGRLTLEHRLLGSSVTEGEQLGSINDPLVDNVHLNELIREKAFVAAEIDRLTNMIAAIEQSISDLQARSERYQRQRIQQLEAELRALTFEIGAAEARGDEAEAAFQRSKKLTDRGLEPSASFERIRATQRVAAQDLESARQRAAIVEIELQAARSGTFLGDGYNDAPYSEQRISELTLDQSEKQALLNAQKAKAVALDNRINVERLRVNRLRSSKLISNVNGTIWEVLAANGETVGRGEPLMRLVNCSSTIVTLSVAESVYNRLKIGDLAKFRVNNDQKVLEGTITRLAGSGAETIYRNLAVAPSERHLQRFDVTLVAPTIREDPALACAIGRTGRVFFEARPLDFLRNLWL